MENYDIEEIQENAKKLKLKLFWEGKWPPKRKVRGKPRSAEKFWLIRQRCLDSLKKYPPRWIDNTHLILPYFYDPEKEENQ